ncbi:MAG: hypothetical protein K2Y56_18560 [Methylobacterium sp.]|uniref:hypothetical protein n=1 Tax=Methylobacterium sp. TaxID=409 RepID=UPI0025F89C73|nr:hypothetical protein [Methylobacterium sp.]MBX9933496.1 hypothetical protein [Methylobacterium sp.]
MILVHNARSSSLLCALFHPEEDAPTWRAHVSEVGVDPRLSVNGGTVSTDRPPAGDHAAVARWLLARLPFPPTAVGHRVVHVAFTDIVLDEAANARGETSIGAKASTLSVRIVPASEEREIARSVGELMVEATRSPGPWS